MPTLTEPYKEVRYYNGKLDRRSLVHGILFCNDPARASLATLSLLRDHNPEEADDLAKHLKDTFTNPKTDDRLATFYQIMNRKVGIWPGLGHWGIQQSDGRPEVTPTEVYLFNRSFPLLAEDAKAILNAVEIFEFVDTHYEAAELFRDMFPKDAIQK